MKGSYNCDKKSLRAIFLPGRIVLGHYGSTLANRICGRDLPSAFARLPPPLKLCRTGRRDKRHNVREPGTGNGMLHAGIPGRELAATKAREEIGEIETTVLGSGGGIWLKITILGLTLSFKNQTTFCGTPILRDYKHASF
jgi:hypothetical protein